ncbi:unnamed protein product, partial [marine sediment metagenome]
VGLLKAVAQIFYWLELEMEALVVRLFLVFAGLITLWFSLRLVYRYWVDRAANNYLKTVGVMLLIVIVSGSVILLDTYLVKQSTPDFSQHAEFEDRLLLLIEQIHGENAD